MIPLAKDDRSMSSLARIGTQPIAVADYKIIVSAAGVTDTSGNHLNGGDDHFIYVHASDLSAAATLASLQ